MKHQALTVTICILLYALCAFLFWQSWRTPPERYPDWTPTQKAILKKVMNRHTTVIRVGMNEAYVVRHGKKWRLKL